MTYSRLNLCARPALKFAGGPGWLTPSAEWVRSTAMHASLPRTTGLAGSVAGDVQCAVAPVVPGRTYIGSVHVRFVAASSGTVVLRWLDATDTLLGATTPVAFTQGANTTARLASAAGVAPAGATCARLCVLSLDGSTQLTGCLVEEAATVGTYFDGDDTGAGASWAAADGVSISRLGATGMSIDVAYDDSRGRVRTFVSGAAPGTGQARVSRRTATTTVYEPVRGGLVDLASGAAIRTADDYEFPPTTAPLVYLVEALAGRGDISSAARGGVEVRVIESAQATFTPPYARCWLKFVAAPHLNRKITVTGWGAIERPDRNSVYEVRERTDPIVITAGHSSRRVTLTLRTWTQAETDALDEALRQGIPGYLHVPAELNLPSLYCVFGSYRYAPPSKRSQGARWELPLIEVAPPPASIYATGATWQTVLDTYPTWAALLAAQPTWQKVLTQ